MEKKVSIDSRKDGATKDMKAAESTKQKYDFPKLGVTVEATSFEEALSLAKEAVKSNKK